MYCAVLLFVLPLSALSALDFTLETDGGILAGSTREYVYEGEKCVSRLDWGGSVTPVLSFAGQASLYGAFLQLKITSAVPVQNGMMEDYDFLIAGSDEPSLYSKHDAYLDKYFDASAMLGYDLRIAGWRITPSAGFAYRNRKWTAADGFLQYPVTGLWTGEEPKQELYGPIISYEQAFWFPVIALEASYVLKERFLLSAGGSLYPVMRGDTVDNHLFRQTQFYDTLREGFGGNIDVRFCYYFDSGKRSALKLSAGYEKTALHGGTAMRETGVSDDKLLVTEGYSSRMESEQWTVTLGVACRLWGDG